VIIQVKRLEDWLRGCDFIGVSRAIFCLIAYFEDIGKLSCMIFICLERILGEVMTYSLRKGRKESPY